MPRKIAGCRRMPSDSGCTLTLTGEEDEVVRAATEHAVSMHGHTDGAELREGIRAELHDALHEQWMTEIGADRTARWFLLGADRDQPGRYVQFVEFPSYGAAMVNSAHPATAASAERLGKLAIGEKGFRNLDIIRARTP